MSGCNSLKAGGQTDDCDGREAYFPSWQQPAKGHLRGTRPDSEELCLGVCLCVCVWAMERDGTCVYVHAEDKDTHVMRTNY